MAKVKAQEVYDSLGVPCPQDKNMSFIVAIVGRPNTGKSTLFNRLTHTRKAIVDPTPGVTRDRNYGEVTWDGKEFTLVDTGGFEPDSTGELVSKMGQQTHLAMEEADAVIFLMDGRAGLTPADHEGVGRLRKMEKTVFYVVNKIDGPEHEDLAMDFYRLGLDTVHTISAEHGYGIGDFMDLLVSHIPSEERAEDVEQITRIAILGRPNVGKSSLVNRLLGEERMVVTEIAGTTRDSVDSLLERAGRKYRLIDTAGIRRKARVSHHLETFSVIKALRSLSECDIALVLIDAGEGVTDQDIRILGYAAEKHKACILVVNKWDLLKNEPGLGKKIKGAIADATPFISYAPLVTASAITGYNIGRLFEVIDQAYVQYTMRVSTGKLNQALRDIVAEHEPPLYRRHPVKLYYGTQATVRPPSFVFFTTSPQGIHASYERYVANQLRKRFGFDKCPVRIMFRQREKRREG